MIAVGALIGSSVLLLGIGATQSSQSIADSNQAAALADACAEDALQRIRINNSLTGTSNLTIGAQDCSYTINNTGGSNREVEAQSTVNNSTRKVKVTIDQLSPIVNVSSWQEVADF